MSKMPLDWHKKCHANATESVARRRLEAERLFERVKADEVELAFYARQIEEAEKRKLDGFDSARLLKQRGKGNG